MELGRTAAEAAVDAGCTRLRPIVMTALAMIIGMLPMALGLGEGGEQNAPLARAVIGGLTLATLATLFFVPLMFSILRRIPAVREETITWGETQGETQDSTLKHHSLLAAIRPSPS